MRAEHASRAERTIWDAINRGIEKIAVTNRDPSKPGKQDADWHDCRQDALLKVQELHEEVHRLTVAENWPALAGLVYTVAHNIAVDWVRKKRPVKYIDAEDDQRTILGVYEAQSPLDRAVEANLFQEVRALLPRISPKDREIFGIYLSLREQERIRAKETLARAAPPRNEREEDLLRVDAGRTCEKKSCGPEDGSARDEDNLWTDLIEACQVTRIAVPSHREDNIYAQIGAILNIDPQTARTRMSRARANLRKLYREKYGELYNAQIT
jgi:RNA polymerase sigma factor (sigma-70 family)